MFSCHCREHIYRVHISSLECPRCYTNFTTKAALDEHQRARVTCELREQQPGENITKEQEELLRKRSKNDCSQGEEDKWTEVYQILFPGDPEVPSPCQLHPVASPTKLVG